MRAMDRFSVEMTTNNAAFVDAGDHMEVARILRHIATRLECGDVNGVCVDINGNKVGLWCLERAEG